MTYVAGGLFALVNALLIATEFYYLPLLPVALAIALMTIGINLVVDWVLSINSRPSGASAEL